MNQRLTLFFLFFLLVTSVEASAHPPLDTLSFWKVSLRGELILQGNEATLDAHYLLTKGKIRSNDLLTIRYFDDTPCMECSASLTLKNKKGEALTVLPNTKGNYDFEIKTTELQMLAFHDRSNYLRFYYKEDEGEEERLLFEIEIR